MKTLTTNFYVFDSRFWKENHMTQRYSTVVLTVWQPVLSLASLYTLSISLCDYYLQNNERSKGEEKVEKMVRKWRKSLGITHRERDAFVQHLKAAESLWWAFTLSPMSGY